MACCEHEHPAPAAAVPAGYRRVLWIALALNALMFVVEVAAGASAGSKSLLADAMDFLGDAANYGLSLYVLDHALARRARVALFKGWTMALFGLVVLMLAARALLVGEPPEAETMGVVGALALLVNVSVALLLYRHRTGDSNMRAVWLCSRNDAIGNIAVMVAAVGVWFTGSAWPDLLVAAGMAVLALVSAREVISHARRDLVAG